MKKLVALLFEKKFLHSIPDIYYLNQYKQELINIDEIYNKCDKKRLLIEIKCSGSPKVLLNELYKKTSLQKTYNPNQYALVSKTPKLLNLKQYLDINLPTSMLEN